LQSKTKEVGTMTIWIAYIERDGRKYFVDRGDKTEIMSMVNRKAAELKLSDDIIHDIEYIEMNYIPSSWLNIEELL